MILFSFSTAIISKRNSLQLQIYDHKVFESAQYFHLEKIKSDYQLKQNHFQFLDIYKN